MWKKIKAWIQKISPKDRFENREVIFKTNQPHLAQIYKMKLENEGIPVIIFDTRDSSYNSFGQILLYVERENIVRAKHLISTTNE